MNLQLHVYLILLFQATGALQTSSIGGRGSDDNSASLLVPPFGDQESNAQSGSLQILDESIPPLPPPIPLLDDLSFPKTSTPAKNKVIT